MLEANHLILESGGACLKSFWVRQIFNQSTNMYDLLTTIYLLQLFTRVVNWNEEKFPNHIQASQNIVILCVFVMISRSSMRWLLATCCRWNTRNQSKVFVTKKNQSKLKKSLEVASQTIYGIKHGTTFCTILHFSKIPSSTTPICANEFVYLYNIYFKDNLWKSGRTSG